MLPRYDTFWNRFVAGIIDSLIFIPLGLLLALIIPFTLYSPVVNFIVNTIFQLVFLAYIVLTTGRTGQTLGKQAMRIRIVTFPEEQQITYKQAFIRELPYAIVLALGILLDLIKLIIPGVIPGFLLWPLAAMANNGAFLWFIIEFATMLSNDMRRAAHDLTAKTVVINVGVGSPIQNEVKIK